MANLKKKIPPFVRSQTIDLKPTHGWRASPGHKVLVISRGDLRFEYPDSWVHEITEQSIKLRDKPFPQDVMVLEISVIRTPNAAKWQKVPALNILLADNLKKQGHLVALGDIHVGDAPGLEFAWADYRKIEEDPQTKLPREATWRQAHAHAGKYHSGAYMPFGIVTFGFWSEFQHLADPVWQHFLDTLVVGQKIDDPAQGPQYN